MELLRLIPLSTSMGSDRVASIEMNAGARGEGDAILDGAVDGRLRRICGLVGGDNRSLITVLREAAAVLNGRGDATNVASDTLLADRPCRGIEEPFNQILSGVPRRALIL